MALNIKDIVVGMPFLTDYASHAMLRENTMFSSLSKFYHTIVSDSIFFFNDPSIELFPSFDTDTSNELNTSTSSPSPTESIPVDDILYLQLLLVIQLR